MEPQKNKFPLFIIVGAVIVIAAIVLMTRGGDDPDVKKKPAITLHGVKVKKQKDDSWSFVDAFKGLFSSDDATEKDLTSGADDPKYKALVDKIDRLYEDFGMLPPDKRDEKKLIVDQAALVIDYQLGPNHPKKKDFLEIVGWSFDARKPLNKKFTDGEIGRQELFKSLTEHFNEVGERYASIFTDEEYQSMFNLEKGESLAETMGLVPEMATALDDAAKNQPTENQLPKDAYKMTDTETMTKEQVDTFKKKYGDQPGRVAEPEDSK